MNTFQLYREILPLCIPYKILVMASGGATSVRKDILKNELYFPSFQGLGEENDLAEQYWKEDIHRCVWTQACTWCFLAEITNDETSQIPFLRNRVIVRDRRGQNNIPISFYPERGHFDFRTLKKGHTVCVMLAEQHHFLDMTTGLRIEGLDTVKVIPCGLEDLLALSTVYSQHEDLCWTCEKKKIEFTSGSTSPVDLKKCAACHIAQYCNKECQVKDWKERHRRWCKALPEFLKMTKIDYTTYNEHALFGLFGRIW